MIALVIMAALALLATVAADVYQRYQKTVVLKSEIASASQPVAGVAQDKPTVSGTRQVAALFLFGKKETRAKPVPQVIDAPITRLKLTLLGAIAADITENSKAIIQIDNKQVAVVQVGDPLPGTNARIHQIQPMQVVLMRNGKLERLAIIRPELEMDERDGGSELLISSGRQSSRDTNSESRSINLPGEPAYPPPPFEMPDLLPPRRQRQ